MGIKEPALPCHTVTVTVGRGAGVPPDVSDGRISESATAGLCAEPGLTRLGRASGAPGGHY